MKTKLFSALLCALCIGLIGCDKNKGKNEPSKPSTGTENGYSWVDLGLSVKWATCNVGASSSEGSGDYFAWGETSPKSAYNWKTYKYCDGSSIYITKYRTGIYSYGIVDDKNTLELTDDAAHVNWGGAWRMPTKLEQDELINNCTWKWTEDYNGTFVRGYIVSSKKNNNSIFLPAVDHRGGNGALIFRYGYYWSSSLDEEKSDIAYIVCFIYNDPKVGWQDRAYGLPVRPVCP